MVMAQLTSSISAFSCRAGLNNGIFIAMRYFSFLLVFLFLGIFGFFSMVSAQNATLYFVPASSAVSPGQTFRVQVMVDTKGEAVNAVAAYFMYPADKFDALAVDRTGSAMTLFAEDKAAAGRVDISGGTPTPGFSGIQKIASVDFRVKPAVTGVAILSFLSDAAILRNSDNQNILNLGSSGKANFQIAAVSSPLPPPPLPPTPPPAGGPTPTPIPTPSPVGGFEEALVISDIAVEPEENSDGDIVVSWKTNRPANSQIMYGTSKEYEFSVLDGSLTTDHSIVLTGVSPQAARAGYSFQILAFDESGGKAQSEIEEYIGPTDSLVPPSQIQNIGFEVGGFEIRLPFLIAFILLPIAVVVVIALVLFSRARARSS